MAGKVATFLELLGTGKEFTIEELIEKSGVSMGTAKMQLNYLLKKNGKVVKINEVAGVKKYSLEK